MSTPTETAQANAEALKAAALKSLEGFQKLAQVNLEHTKAALDASAEQFKALLGAKDVKALTDLATSWVKPGAEAVVGYAKAVQAAATETGTELAAHARAQLDKGTAELVTQLETLAKSAPAGSEGVVTLVKEALAVATTTFDQVSAAGKKLVDAGVATATAAAAQVGKKG